MDVRNELVGDRGCAADGTVTISCADPLSNLVDNIIDSEARSQVGNSMESSHGSLAIGRGMHEMEAANSIHTPMMNGMADKHFKLDVNEQLKSVFGLEAFRHGQEEVINASMEGRDLFVLLPTGGGKSLCYQLPAICCPGLTVVISPLTSLIHDQVSSLKSISVKAASLTSDQGYKHGILPVLDKLHSLQKFGSIKLLYLTPEKIVKSPATLTALKDVYSRGLLSRFVIDEAHCISDWGHDFRPDYQKLNILREEFPGVPISALTATANEMVIDDIVRVLKLHDHLFHKRSFNRPNLDFSVRRSKRNKIEEIVDVIMKYPRECGLVYCFSRKECEDVANQLCRHPKVMLNSIVVSYYHAGIAAKHKMILHQDWSNKIVHVVCATLAFGMGINNLDVRYVIHYSFPRSITALYQESGRAGRDGKFAECIIYYSLDQKNRQLRLINKGNASFARIQTCIDDLNDVASFCDNEVECRRVQLLRHLGESFERNNCLMKCDNCRGLDYTETDKIRNVELIPQKVAKINSNELELKSSTCNAQLFRKMEKTIQDLNRQVVELTSVNAISTNNLIVMENSLRELQNSVRTSWPDGISSVSGLKGHIPGSSINLENSIHADGSKLKVVEGTIEVLHDRILPSVGSEHNITLKHDNLKTKIKCFKKKKNAKMQKSQGVTTRAKSLQTKLDISCFKSTDTEKLVALESDEL